MALVKRGQYHYGEAQSDIRTELLRYSEKNAYRVDHFADPVCKCDGKVFRLAVDEGTAAVRICVSCGDEHPIGDSADYLDEAELGMCECPCGESSFEITVGVSLYDDSEDVRWIYIGCRCVGCGLTACYGDWKNEYNRYQELLKQV
jgi:hypothetical protein